MRFYFFIVALFILEIGFTNANGEETVFHNPVDQKNYIADWKTYTPENATQDSNARVMIKNVRLLSSQDLFDKNTQVKELSNYIKQIALNVETSVAKFQDGGELIVETELTSDKRPKFNLGYKDNLSKDFLQAVYDGLEKLPDFRSAKDVVSFQVNIQINASVSKKQ